MSSSSLPDVSSAASAAAAAASSTAEAASSISAAVVTNFVTPILFPLLSAAWCWTIFFVYFIPLFLFLYFLYRHALVLTEGEQAVVRNFTRVTTQNGPGFFILFPFSKVDKRKALVLSPNEYSIIRNKVSGQLSRVVGPTLYFLSSQEELVRSSPKFQLSETEFLHVTNTTNGTIRSVRGPSVFVPEHDEVCSQKQEAIALKKNEYIQVLDGVSGALRTIPGETLVFLSAHEKIVTSKRMGLSIDGENAVLIRDTETGQQHLLTKAQVFIPNANQEVLEVRNKIRLEQYHTAVVKNNETGSLEFVNGPSTFFLKPYCELLTQNWSTGINKDKRDLVIQLFDSRPHFMWYEFFARTKDNVEILLGVTFFWALRDVRLLVQTTSDPAGDLCAHARSVIIDAISGMVLEEFLADFNRVVETAVMKEGEIKRGMEEKETEVLEDKTSTKVPISSAPKRTPAFYAARGVLIEGVEVRSVQCKDRRTQDVLQEIIQERTNRINRLQKQESENEVLMKQLEGQIEFENINGRLLEARKLHATSEGEKIGQQEAARVRAFLEGLSGIVTEEKDRMELFRLLRKGDAIKDLSTGSNVSLMFTPSDVDLKIDARGGR